MQFCCGVYWICSTPLPRPQELTVSSSAVFYLLSSVSAACSTPLKLTLAVVLILSIYTPFVALFSLFCCLCQFAVVLGRPCSKHFRPFLHLTTCLSNCPTCPLSCLSCCAHPLHLINQFRQGVYLVNVPHPTPIYPYISIICLHHCPLVISQMIKFS